MKDQVVQTKAIKINVGLDAKNVPVHMDWDADDQSPDSSAQDCKAILISLFDKEHRDTLKIDLWTTEMQIQEMDRFFYQTMRGLADTYFNATKNHKLANEMRRFVEYFGEETNIIPKKTEE